MVLLFVSFSLSLFSPLDSKIATVAQFLTPLNIRRFNLAPIYKDNNRIPMQDKIQFKNECAKYRDEVIALAPSPKRYSVCFVCVYHFNMVHL